jgi:hypothetical protein
MGISHNGLIFKRVWPKPVSERVPNGAVSGYVPKEEK